MNVGEKADKIARNIERGQQQMYKIMSMPLLYTPIVTGPGCILIDDLEKSIRECG